jgi:hypothetical protein
MSRQHDWVAQMWSCIEDHGDAVFAWGVNDCCLFTARVIDRMTGTDHELDLQAAYSDEATALAYIASHGDLQTAVSSHLGAPAAGRAQRGDAVMVDGGAGYAVGICVGSSVALLQQQGLVFLPRSEIITRWAIE